MTRKGSVFPAITVVDTGIQAGMDAHIAKPIDLRVLLSVLVQVLDKWGAVPQAGEIALG